MTPTEWTTIARSEGICCNLLGPSGTPGSQERSVRVERYSNAFGSDLILVRNQEKRACLPSVLLASSGPGTTASSVRSSVWQDFSLAGVMWASDIGSSISKWVSVRKTTGHIIFALKGGVYKTLLQRSDPVTHTHSHVCEDSIIVWSFTLNDTQWHTVIQTHQQLTPDSNDFVKLSALYTFTLHSRICQKLLFNVTYSALHLYITAHQTHEPLLTQSFNN